MAAETIIEILRLALKYGPQLVIDMMLTWDKTTITDKDMEELKALLEKETGGYYKS